VGDITQEDHPDIPAGSVIRTNPAAGVEVEAGEQIDLVISRGPSPSPTPSPTPVPTPTPTPVPTPTPTLPPTPEPSA
jgi:serine/threonine-protein kinase